MDDDFYSIDEMIKALQFYKVIEQALTSPGIKKVVVTMTEDGELEANVYLNTSPDFS